MMLSLLLRGGTPPHVLDTIRHQVVAPIWRPSDGEKRWPSTSLCAFCLPQRSRCAFAEEKTGKHLKILELLTLSNQTEQSPSKSMSVFWNWRLFLTFYDHFFVGVGCISSDPQNVSQNSHRLNFLVTRWWRNCNKNQWYDLRPFYQSIFFSKRLSQEKVGPFGWFSVSRDEDPLWLILGDFVKLKWPAVDSAWSHNRSNQTKVCVVWRGVEISLSNQGGHFCDAQVRPHVEVHGIDNLDERNFEMFRIVGAWIILDL